MTSLLLIVVGLLLIAIHQFFYPQWKEKQEYERILRDPKNRILYCPRCGRIAAVVIRGSIWDNPGSAQCIDLNCNSPYGGN